MSVIYVKLILDIGHYRGQPRTYLKREIGWPVGLPFPGRGEWIMDRPADDDDGESSVEVQWIEYRPLDLRNQAIIHCKEEIAGREGDETTAEYAAKHHPHWKPR